MANQWPYSCPWIPERNLRNFDMIIEDYYIELTNGSRFRRLRRMRSSHTEVLKTLKDNNIYYPYMEDIDFSQYLFGPSEAEVEQSENLLVKHTNGDTNGDNINHSIFFTINPSDYYWKEKYGIPTHENTFRQELSNEFNKLINYYKKNKQIKLDVHIHFECTNGRVHSHGVIIGLPESYYPYEGELKYMSKWMHKIFGKPRLNSNICADFRWTNDQWNGSYIVKQNYLPPIRIVYE